MTNELELLNKILATMDRLKKSGTLEHFLATAPEPKWDDVDWPTVAEGYDAMYASCLHKGARALHEAEKFMGIAKHYVMYVDKLYKNYADREEEIKNPEILKFIKDYRKANGIEKPPEVKRPPLRNIAKCAKCGDIIESKSRHNFVECSCKAIFVDGGNDYIRRGGNPEDFDKEFDRQNGYQVDEMDSSE